MQTTGQEGHTGRWTPQEHQAFITAVNQYGRNWRMVATQIGTRAPIQVSPPQNTTGSWLTQA